MNLYNIFIYTVPFLIVLSLLVFMHEFGHYLVAKYFGVRIETFSIGFGKAIYSFSDRHKTVWKISILPLGGYVKMFGDASEDSAPDHKLLDNLSQAEKEATFFYKKPWQKILIAAAGPLMNFFLAIVIITALFFFHGYPEASNVIATVAEGSVAAKAGLLPGDQIIAINQHKVSSMNEIRSIIALNNNQKTNITFKRAGADYKINLTPETKIIQDSFGKEIKIGYLGLATDMHYVKNTSFLKATMLATKETYNLSINTLKALKQIIIGQRSYKELGGPLHIAGIIGNTAKIGIIPLIWLAAIISANLGLINLLPIPALDGGHIICYSWELIFSKPLAPTYQLTAFRIGMYFIIAIFLFITFNDIRHLIYKVS